MGGIGRELTSDLGAKEDVGRVSYIAVLTSFELRTVIMKREQSVRQGLGK